MIIDVYKYKELTPEAKINAVAQWETAKGESSKLRIREQVDLFGVMCESTGWGFDKWGRILPIIDSFLPQDQ